jgi:hypothetical protein
MKLPSLFPGSLGGTALAVVLAVSAQAQTTTVTPHADFQDATLTSTTNTIDATRVPALDSTGKLHYWNIQIVFDTAADGTLTLATGYPIITQAENPLTADFKAGTYVASNGAKIIVSGPGVTSGGATEWSLAQSGTICSFPYSATWYVGALTSNPLYARIKTDGITSTAYSYGLLGTSSSCGSQWWDSGALLGLSQTGNALNIVSFSNDGSDDSITPQAQITFTYEP